MQRFRRVFISTLMLVPLLAACAAPGFSATASTDNLRVTLDIARLAVGMVDARVTISDHQGRPVAADAITLLPVMPTMGHLNPEIAMGAGVDVVRTVALFSMTGEWTVWVRVTVAGEEAMVSFDLRVP